MEFESIFTVSFKEYCQINDLEEASEEMVNKWRKDVIQNYSKEAEPKVVMAFFNIPKEYKNSIEYHEYEVHEIDYALDNKEKILNISLVLKITR